MNKKIFVFAASVLLLTACGSDNSDEKTPVSDTRSPQNVQQEPQPVTEVNLSGKSFQARDEIEVTYDVVGEIDDGAWMGIIPTDTEHGSESKADEVDVSYKYLNGEKNGTMTFQAPDEVGEYDVRIFSSDGDGAEELGASGVFKVE